MTRTADPVGTLDAALAHAARLLDTRPLLAAEQAQEILKVVPGQPMAKLVLARAKLRLDAVEEALPLLQSLSAAKPGFAIAQCELGLTLRRLGRSGEAIARPWSTWMLLASLLRSSQFRARPAIPVCAKPRLD